MTRSYKSRDRFAILSMVSMESRTRRKAVSEHAKAWGIDG